MGKLTSATHLFATIEISSTVPFQAGVNIKANFLNRLFDECNCQIKNHMAPLEVPQFTTERVKHGYLGVDEKSSLIERHVAGCKKYKDPIGSDLLNVESTYCVLPFTI